MDTTVYRLDQGALDKFERTQVGGVRIPARLSRVGVLRYMEPDGTMRRELRLPDEVFKADSMKTLEGAPVVDFKHHVAMVSPDTYCGVALGSVTNVRRDGEFIAGELAINDGDTLEAIEEGERVEISLGYMCHLDWTPGVHEGAAYDCVQRDIRYNHAALCPPNRGRAGPEVRLRLDSAGNAVLDGEDTHDDLRLALARAERDALVSSAWRADATTRTRSRLSGSLGGVEGRSVSIIASTPEPVGDGQPAITEWDLSRFEKNPTILWAHDQAGINLPIGTASDVTFGPEGLRMVASFATERANPLAEQVLQCIAEGIIRAVSVGYEDLGDGRARLLEVSFVPIGLDEDAGTADLNPDAVEGGAERKRSFDSSRRVDATERPPDASKDIDRLLELEALSEEDIAALEELVDAAHSTTADAIRKRLQERLGNVTLGTRELAEIRGKLPALRTRLADQKAKKAEDEELRAYHEKQSKKERGGKSLSRTDAIDETEADRELAKARASRDRASFEIGGSASPPVPTRRRRTETRTDVADDDTDKALADARRQRDEAAANAWRR